MINENIKEEAELVQKMILEFFQEECKEFFNPTHQSLVNCIFKRTKVLYDDIITNGHADYKTRTIQIRKSLSLNTERVLSFLLHEYAHMFIDKNFHFYERQFPKLVSEGMSDTFSDLVMNYYFTKHPNVILKGRKLNIQLPYVSCSKYKFENGWIRTMLYPLEKSRKDKEAIIELLLGTEPTKFFELTLGKAFKDTIPLDENGFPIEINISYKRLYLEHQESYHNINKNSIYYQKNHILPAFIIQEKIENQNEIPIYDLHNDTFNRNFINNTYFNHRKLYEITPEELKEFVELYYQSRTSSKVFIEEYDEFANFKIEELTNEEIEKHSIKILNSLKELLKGFAFYDMDYLKIGSKCEEVIYKTFQNILKIVNNCEEMSYIINIYQMIYPDYLLLLKKARNDNGKMLKETLENIESIFINRINFLKAKNPEEAKKL